MAAEGRAPGHPAAWFVLLLAGQAATLQLIQAGPRVGYQHYLRIEQLFAGRPAWAAGAFVLQAMLAAWGLQRGWPAVRGVMRGLGAWRLGMVGAAFVLTSATLSRSPAVYVQELLLASLVHLVQLATVVLLALTLRGRDLDALPGWARDQSLPVVAPGGPDRFSLLLAAGVTLVAALLAAASYQRHPHIPDEVSYLLHARYLAAGQLSMPLPPVPEAFSVDLMTYQADRWFSPMPPGWPLLLAVGVLAGVPWLVNPVLAGVNVLLAAILLNEIYPRRTGRLALLLLAVSPWHLFMSMNLMNHTASFTFALLGALGVARLRRDPRVRWAALGGFGIGMVGLLRPLEGFALAGLLGLWSLGARGRRWRFAPAAWLTAFSALAGAAVMPYNRHLTGSATLFPVMDYFNTNYGPGTNDLGFGPDRGVGWASLDPFPGHGLVDVLVNANFNLFQTNTELLGWATGSLLVLLLFVAAGPLRRVDWWMLAVIVVVAGIHSLYYFSGGPDFGARYWYLILLPSLALTARGLEWLAERSERASPGDGRRVLAGAAALALVSLVVFVPWRASDKYYHYRLMRPDVRTLLREYPFGDGVVLVRGNRHPDYASAVVYNPVDLTERVPLIAWDRGREVRARLAAAYTDRSFWIVDGPTRTGRGYEVVAGPLTGREVAALPNAGPMPPR